MLDGVFRFRAKGDLICNHGMLGLPLWSTFSEILWFRRVTSPVGTFVWTGRALQAGFEQMEGGLAPLYPALAWSVCAPGHHGYPRAPDLILRKALRGR